MTIEKMAARSGRVLKEDDSYINEANMLEEIHKGGYDTPSHDVVVVAGATTPILPQNPGRLYALFVNDSDQVIYLKLGVDAVLNEGIRLNADGGSYEMSKGLRNLYKGEINGICASGGKNLLVTEGI